MRSRLFVGALALALVSVADPDPVSGAQVCGCRRNTTGRVNRITWGSVPSCSPSAQTLVCWDDA